MVEAHPSSGSGTTPSSDPKPLWTRALPRFARRYGAGQRPVRVKQRVDRDLLQLTEAIWLLLDERGITAPSKKRRRR